MSSQIPYGALLVKALGPLQIIWRGRVFITLQLLKSMDNIAVFTAAARSSMLLSELYMIFTNSKHALNRVVHEVKIHPTR